MSKLQLLNGSIPMMTLLCQQQIMQADATVTWLHLVYYLVCNAPNQSVYVSNDICKHYYFIYTHTHTSWEIVKYLQNIRPETCFPLILIYKMIYVTDKSGNSKYQRQQREYSHTHYCRSNFSTRSSWYYFTTSNL